ncbi:sulfite reductase (NADPH) flavoprotein alpha-component [Pullulanibacillus pueri]|uniref:assimilatory sulfite reductase (NADPH) n=1 Tax=Pullulanibacillus pueri TaxID=1437324 RepID=A0A8J2ZTU5_9BACL|nr:assimilatory sulfite reductase (NADPH) flavoprotein subunit [Pullulanibacillus pueri]MBM7681266.1 sulfite reductase (NADPH) flavoprotein alpha-component [Pullulanibacillus pueri]GGH77823.1 sulfite reductase [NADPH] flavoprotein alpha-component [Pullulanibacillus pueri]
MQLQVTNSPFNQEQTEILNQLLPTLTETQKIWLSGYLAAPQTAAFLMTPESRAKNQPVAGNSPQSIKPSATREVTVLFGSETGNCQALSEDLSQKLEEKGFKVVLSSMDDFKTKDLKKVQDLLIITATHGEGDPPDNALSFYEFLNSRKAPKLKDVRFSVLALGDQSYEFYCQTGKDFDQRLEALGAERLHPRVDCDVDFDDLAAEWMEGVLGQLQDSSQVGQVEDSNVTKIAQLQTGATIQQVTKYSRTHPFQAEVLENLNLSGRGSNKENRHLELSLEGSNLEFEPGDSLGIYPENDPALVDRIIAEMQWDPEAPVTINKVGEVPLRIALLSHYEITILTKPLMEKAAQLSSNGQLKALVAPGNEEKLKAYIDGRDLLDLLHDYSPWEVPAKEILGILRKLPARLYSIASSYKANPDEVHLTIGTVRFHAHGRDRAGVCSVQCAERVKPGDKLSVYVHKNPNFRLPADPDAPVIMIGPGTGVAPFRSFLEEREEIGATGKTWLFFGDQHFRTDFLYQVDWQRWLKEGVLSRMDVAFSRDTAEKVYVQHRMLAKSKELYQWIQEGASVYVCGDEKHMAKDVHDTLLAILQQEGGMDQEAAENYLTDLRKQKRYQRDVY